MTDEERAEVEAKDNHKAALKALMAAEAAEYGAWEAVRRARDVNKNAQAARERLAAHLDRQKHFVDNVAKKGEDDAGGRGIPEYVRQHENPRALDCWLESLQGECYKLFLEVTAIKQSLRYGTWIQRLVLWVHKWVQKFGKTTGSTTPL